MAAINMPNTPTNGEQFTASNGITYVWDGVAWTALGGDGGQGASIQLGVDPPTTPVVGQLWFDTANGILYVWFVDEDQDAALGEGQWVDTRPAGVS